jgi:C4-dicarboxylate-specific signal transduction histidine kinase
VSDAGLGIAPANFNLLLEPFHTTKAESMDIGLSDNQEIFERHNGRLWPSPNSGSGITFPFSIPGSMAYAGDPP